MRHRITDSIQPATHIMDRYELVVLQNEQA